MRWLTRCIRRTWFCCGTWFHSLSLVDDPEVGSYTFARSTPHLSAAPDIVNQPSPSLGQHTREVLEDVLGYSVEEVDRLAEDGVVGVVPS